LRNSDLPKFIHPNGIQEEGLSQKQKGAHPPEKRINDFSFRFGYGLDLNWEIGAGIKAKSNVERTWIAWKTKYDIFPYGSG